MTHSRLIAGLMGPVLLAMGIAMLFRRQVFPVMASQFTQDYGLIFLSGILLLLAGIAIVRVHNVWAASWEVIITALGWLAVVSGLVRMWFPDSAAAMITAVGDISSIVGPAGLVMLVLGAFLSFKGYSPNAASR
jgi:uncharacterized protein YjeT (DUF2065 family)